MRWVSILTFPFSLLPSPSHVQMSLRVRKRAKVETKEEGGTRDSMELD